MSPRVGRRAVVIGASIAGLLAARVLAEAYDEVELIDRDLLRSDASPRGGVPQGRHAHALLARGCLALDDLLPGFADDLIAHGAPTGDLLGDNLLYFGGHRCVRTRSGLRSLSASRALLESRVRAHLTAFPQVKVTDRTDVTGLLTDGASVLGVLVSARADGRGSQPVAADLVVDASGRGSRLPEWLAELGWPEPPEDRVRVDLGYSSRRYRMDRHLLDGDLMVVYSAFPGHPRGVVAMVLEDGCGLVTLAGMLGDHPPTDPAGFRRFAHSLPLPVLHRIVDTAEPVDRTPVGFRIQDSIRRRYDRIGRFPSGLLVTGDAVCSFNPIYGQGMTVAAVGALVLRDELRRGGPPDARRHARTLISATRAAWDLSAGADRAFPGVTGERSTTDRVLARYVRRIQRASAEDPAMATAFARVANLVSPPGLLMRPDVVFRALRPRSTRAARPRPGSPPTGARPDGG
jgi:2-polyprenyl-6-methoxyphenol hydroxylase-like FAD-dependent oxidoreductase